MYTYLPFYVPSFKLFMIQYKSLHELLLKAWKERQSAVTVQRVPMTDQRVPVSQCCLVFATTTRMRNSVKSRYSPDVKPVLADVKVKVGQIHYGEALDDLQDQTAPKRLWLPVITFPH